MIPRLLPCIFISLVLIQLSCSRASDSSSDSSPAESVMDSLNKFDAKVTELRNINSKKSIEYARKSIRLKDVNKFPKALIKANIILGTALMTEQTDSGYFYLSEAMKISSQYGINEFMQEIYYNLSKIYTESMDYKMAMIYLDSVLHTGKNMSRFDLISNAYNDLGVLKLNLHDNEDAKRLFDNSLRIATVHSLKKQIGVALGNLARLENDPKIVKTLMRKALNVLQQTTGAESAIAQLKIDIGNRCDDPDSAIFYYKSAINAVDTGSSDEILLIAYNNLAYSYIDKKEVKQAECFLVNRAIPIAEKWKNFDWLATLYDTYSDVLLAENKPHEAAMAEKKSYKCRETAYDLKVTGQLRLLSVLLDVKDKELRIQSEQKISQGKTNRIRVLLGIICLFPVILGILWIWSRQRHKLLLERQRLLSANKILKLDETFRSRMAMELHDMTSPLYTSLLRQIEDAIISDAGIKEQLINNLKELSGEIRVISHKMAGGFYENLPVGQMVQGLCHEMQYRTDAQIHLQVDKDPIPVSTDRIHHVVRIIQELLSNGVKYVKQGEIRLILSVELNNLNIIYHDNGPGFSTGSVGESGLGLTNIVERANLIHGKAFLRSEPGKGTHWTIRIPLD
ncbi:MAG: ATP-binding protein [Bacteroidota bacterium]|nr:ATP-binding protein [Bacteroidota bacterium]